MHHSFNFSDLEIILEFFDISTLVLKKKGNTEENSLFENTAKINAPKYISTISFTKQH